MSTRKKRWNLSRLDTPEWAPDVLEFGDFAKAIARGLIRSRPRESLITAIYGPWGSGKTWLKHRILRELRKRPGKITVIEFSPWQIRGVDEVTLQFFAQIHACLVTAADKKVTGGMLKRAKIWIALARLSGAGTAALKMIGAAASMTEEGSGIGGALTAAAGVSDHFSKLLLTAAEDVQQKEKKHETPATTDEAHAMLAELFAKGEVPPLLIVIDDFDRLASDEIQTLIRLIKANANFPGLNYLLLCDPDHLAAALDPVAANKGKEFLEKIVQNPIRLPSPHPDAIFRQLVDGLQDVASRCDYPIQSQLDRLRAYFQNFLQLHLRTLRSVYRLLAVVDFSAATLTRGHRLEVDLLDLVAVDYLRIHAPEFVAWIQRVRPSFYLFTALRDLFDENKKQPLAEILPKTVIDSLGVENSYAVMRTLFPEVAKQFPSDEAAYDRSQASLTTFSKDYPLALSEEEHFDAYFRLQPSPSKVPESVYERAVRDSPSRSSLAESFADWISNGWFQSAVRRLKAEATTFSNERKTTLLLALADCSDAIAPVPGDDDVLNEQLRASMYLMEDFIDQLPEPQRAPVISNLLQTSNAITARSLLLEQLRIRREPSAWPNREARQELPVFKATAIEDFATSLAADASDRITQHKYFEGSYEAFRIYRWAYAIGPQRVEEFFREAIKSGDDKILLTIVRVLARAAAPQFDTSFEVAESFPGSPSKGLLTTLCNLVPDATWRDVLSLFEKNFPPSDSPRDGDDCLIQHLRRALNS